MPSKLIKGALSALRKEPEEHKMLQGFYRGFAGTPEKGETVYHAGAKFHDAPRPGTFTTPDKEAALKFGKTTGAKALHEFKATPRRSGSDADVIRAAKMHGVYEPGVPVGQYLEQGENAVFDASGEIVQTLRDFGYDSLRLHDAMSEAPSLVVLDPSIIKRPADTFVTPQKRVADYYAQKRAGQTGQEPHAEMVLADPFAGRAYGHSTPGTGATEPMTTKARKLRDSDIVDRTPLYAQGGSVATFKDGGKADKGGAAFNVFPQMRPRRSKQDPEAAKNVPVDLARGFVAGTLGMPGDIESLVRMLPGLDERTILPTSEDIEKRLPLRSDTPVSRAASGLGILGGGFYTGPGSAARAITAVPGAIKRAGADFAQAAGQSGPNVIKNKGGNFIDQHLQYYTGKLKRGGDITPEELADMEQHLLKAEATWDQSTPKARRELAGMREHFNAVSTNRALDTWVDQKFKPYVKNQMGTPEDPIRKLIEQGVYHMPEESLQTLGFLPEEVATARKRYGFPEEGMAVQKHEAEGFPEANDARVRAAEGWEAATDTLLNPKHASEFRGADLSQNPWISKLDPNAPIHEIPEYESPRHLGFDHIMDVLREDVAAGRIRPEQLSKITMEQAVRRTFEYDQQLAKKMQSEKLALREGLPVYKEYPEGYRWVELNRPGAFAAESDAMGHSVRGYEPPKGSDDWIEGSGEAGNLGYGHGGWDAIKSGRAKVYSLVDEKGNPHVTVEVGRASPGRFYDLPEDVRDELQDSAWDKIRAVDDPNLWNRDGNLSDYGRLQMQSTQDALMKEWLAQNASSLPQEITQIKGKQNAAPKEDYLPFVQDFVRSGQWSDVGDIGNTGLRSAEDWVNPDTLAKYRELGLDVPKYATDTELERLHDQYIRAAEPRNSPEGYAGGGSVKTGIKGGVDLARRSLFGLKPSQDTAGRELVPVQRELDKMQAELNKAEKVAPKVEERTVSIDPGKGSAKVTDTIQKVASTPVSRRTVLKSATGQVLQSALPAQSFADLLKPVEVAKQAAKVVAPTATPFGMPGMIAAGLREGMSEDDVAKMILGTYRTVTPEKVERTVGSIKDPSSMAFEEPVGAGRAMMELIGTEGPPIANRGALRYMRHIDPAKYDELRQTAKDIAEYGFED